MVSNQRVDEPSAGGARRYDNRSRLERATRTRDAVYQAAFELFCDRGYEGASLTAIAAAAGVSVETVHKMGSKAQLLDGARAVGMFGSDEYDGIRDTPFLQNVAAAAGFDDAVDLLVDFYAASNARLAPFWRAWSSAALSDPHVAESWQKELRSARRGFEDGVRFIHHRRWLRTDVGTEELAATLWVLASAETYIRLTADMGMSTRDYRRWLRRSIVEQLGRPDPS